MKTYRITLVGFNGAERVVTVVAEDTCLALEQIWYHPVQRVFAAEKSAIVEIHIKEVQ